jgi:transposase InsO family protein
VNPKKCSFSVSSFECLGYSVDGNGYRPDANRFLPLTKACSPGNINELRSLIGALQYYSRFIPNFSQQAAPLFEILSGNEFIWLENHERCLREILRFLQTNAVLRPFSPNAHSVLITDASPEGIGAILEQDGHPVICVSRRLSKAEQGYAQTHREALAVYWAVKRLHKYLFGTHFTIITDHEALKFIYDPGKSLARSSAAMVQRWSISLSAYDYEIQHRSAKYIPHVDYVSRQSLPPCESESDATDCLLVQPLPVSRMELIRDTRRYFGAIINALKKGWSLQTKKKFPQYYSRREEFSVTPDGILCLNDHVVIPPTLCDAVLEDLHSGHMGVEKMKALARLTCWWPNLNADICRKATSCSQCHHKLKSTPSKWVPWPVSTEAWQRVHADYCGPFLNGTYALVVIDSYSKWPEVFFTNSPTAEFTIHALRKVFSREGVPLVLVTENGSHFSANIVTQWLQGIGCKHLFTAPCQPCFNGQAENFVKTLKSVISSIAPSTFKELERGVDNFLLQYRNCTHTTTKETPAKLFKARCLRSNLRCIDSAEITYFRGNDLRPSSGLILKNVGNRMVRLLDLDDLSVHNRHIDQIRFEEPGELVPIQSVPSQPNILPLDDSTDDTNAITECRRSERLQNKPRLDYRSVVNSTRGGCGDR